MSRPANLMTLPWTIRLRSGDAMRQPQQRSAALPWSSPRPGIAPRWKPRDRVSAAGN
ncbi:MAG TPA: hypothetical protein VFV55_10635 [Usitatibacteraceae bacterium]|nr:hypothetical protein [Usitatibacteraceae bacterium]